MDNIRTIGDLLRTKNPDKLNAIQRNVLAQIRRERPFIDKELSQYDEYKEVPKTIKQVKKIENPCELGWTQYTLWKELKQEEQFYKMLKDIRKQKKNEK